MPRKYPKNEKEFTRRDLRGPAGPPGSDGAQGPAGNDGADGAQGPAGNDGAQGPQGTQGPAGSDGADGQGVPTGGTTGQVLKKQSGTDFDTDWEDESGGGGGGATIDLFQVADDGSTGQLTTGTAADLAGMWGTPAVSDTPYSWNGTTGELTINAVGVPDFTVVVQGWNNANNRNETHVLLLRDTGGGYSKIAENSNYSSRNNTQDEGGAMIPGFLVPDHSSGDKYKLQVFDIGVAVTIGAANVANQTYLSVRLYG